MRSVGTLIFERPRPLSRQRRANHLYTLICEEPDKFKQLNDTFGHYAGDQALTAVGWALRHANTATAIIGRAGGEEFIVVDCLSQQDAEALPERLRADIAALPHPITASVGAAIVALSTVTDPSASITNLVRTADAAMYHAKRNGGNQVHTRRPDS